MVGSASASAAMQLRMSPTGGDAQLRAQLARRAAVVGHGDHGGDVAGDLLEAPQQGRQAGAAADGHDARTARQRALLVHQLDERLAARRERLQQHAQQPPQPDHEDGHPDQRPPAGAQQSGRNWRLTRSNSWPARLSAGTSRNSCRMTQRAGDAPAAAAPRNTTSSQPLMPVPGRSQRRQARLGDAVAHPGVRHRCVSSSRCQTSTGPRSSARRSCGQLPRDGHRAMEAAGAADGDGQPGLALGQVGGDGEREEARAGTPRNRCVTGWPSTNSRTGSVSP